jgi:hypothetical protein
MLSLFVLVFSIEFGMLDGSEVLHSGYFETRPGSNYVAVDAELRYGALFVGGGIENQQYFSSVTPMSPAFTPFRAIYSASAGARYRGIEVGWRHFCDHPVRSLGSPDTPIQKAESRIYIKYEGKIGG